MRVRGIVRVYPRVGGGNADLMAQTLESEGLSPRGRGKRAYRRVIARGYRSIPAWAGETR